MVAPLRHDLRPGQHPYHLQSLSQIPTKSQLSIIGFHRCPEAGLFRLCYSYIFRMVFPFDFPAATFCNALFTSLRGKTSSTEDSICRSENISDAKSLHLLLQNHHIYWTSLPNRKWYRLTYAQRLRLRFPPKKPMRTLTIHIRSSYRRMISN